MKERKIETERKKEKERRIKTSHLGMKIVRHGHNSPQMLMAFFQGTLCFSLGRRVGVWTVWNVCSGTDSHVPRTTGHLIFVLHSHCLLLHGSKPLSKLLSSVLTLDNWVRRDSFGHIVSLKKSGNTLEVPRCCDNTQQMVWDTCYALRITASPLKAKEESELNSSA